MKIAWTVVLFCIGIVLMAQGLSPSTNLLLRRYQEGEKLTYKMKGLNEQWHYEIQADGIVKKSPDGTYFEEFAWSHLISDGKESLLSPATSSLRQDLTLDPKRTPGFPNLSQVDPRLVGPLTDLLTFYVDVRLAIKNGNLAKAGDHFYFKRGTPASWADGNYVLVGESSIDFDITLKKVDQSNNTVILLARHVPPEKPEVKLLANWMHKPVADTPNNWVLVQKGSQGKYSAAVGKEIFNDEIVLSLASGKILSATMDNLVQTVERECTDIALTQCGEQQPHLIRRQIKLSLQH
jgi:hypothetical protein